MKYLSLISLLLLLISCGGPEEEVIDINDIMPSSERNYNDKEAEKEVDSLDQYRKFFQVLNGELSAVELLEDRKFPDRFGPDYTLAVQCFGEDTIEYRSWSYKDSASTMNAFFNWLDCFGDNCKSFRIAEPSRMQKEAMLLLVGDTSLIYVSSRNIHMKDWYDFLEGKGYANKWNYAIEQKHWGKPEWFTIIDKIKTKIE